MLLSILMVNLNANTNHGLDSTLSYYDEMESRLIANSGIEIYLAKLRADKTLSGYFPDNNLMGGTYSVSIWGPDTLLHLKAVAVYNNVTHISMITAKRIPVKLPKINSALYVSSNNLDFQLAGNMTIDGTDHNTDGSAGPSPALPGIGVNSSADSTYVVNDLKPKISNAILGAGGSPSVTTAADSTDWMAVTQNYIFAADYTLPTGTYSTGTVLGTPADPKITYVSGNVDFSGTSSGAGIMVVNGNLSLNGNFTFQGILIVFGQSQIVTKTDGNSGIYGSAIFVGESVDFQATGNASFFYSSQAINNAKMNLKSSRFQILSWWE